MPTREARAAQRSGRRNRPSAMSTRSRHSDGTPAPPSTRTVPRQQWEERHEPGRASAMKLKARASGQAQLPAHRDHRLLARGHRLVDDERRLIGTPRRDLRSGGRDPANGQTRASRDVEGRVRPQTEHETIGRDRRPERHAQRPRRHGQPTVKAKAKRVAHSVRRRRRQKRRHRTRRRTRRRIRGARTRAGSDEQQR
jgi:hypothetical protein